MLSDLWEMLPKRIFYLSFLLVKMSLPDSILRQCVRGHCSPAYHQQHYSAYSCSLKACVKKGVSAGMRIL